MDLLLKDIKETLGAASVTLPLPNLAMACDKTIHEDLGGTMTDAMSKLRLEGIDGGVALPMNSTRRSVARAEFQPTRAIGPVGTAG